jgi:hypothetical protein
VVKALLAFGALAVVAGCDLSYAGINLSSRGSGGLRHLGLRQHWRQGNHGTVHRIRGNLDRGIEPRDWLCRSLDERDQLDLRRWHHFERRWRLERW